MKLLQDNITNLNQTIESLQLNLKKEIAEQSRLGEELSKINDQSKAWNSEKSALERQVSYLFIETSIVITHDFFSVQPNYNFYFRFLSIKPNLTTVKQLLNRYKEYSPFKTNNLKVLKKLYLP